MRDRFAGPAFRQEQFCQVQTQRQILGRGRDGLEQGFDQGIGHWCILGSQAWEPSSGSEAMMVGQQGSHIGLLTIDRHLCH